MFLPYQTIKAGREKDSIVTIAMNRPQVANALNIQMALELADAFSTVARERNNCRVVVLSGLGKHFCAGADLKERKGMSKKAWHEQHDSFEQAVKALLACPMPVMAAVHGAALGGGLELAMACDFIYASSNARFGLTETSLGIMPGLGGTQQLPRRVGMARAKELILSGKPFSAKEAYGWGLVNKLCTQPSLAKDALAAAQNIAANAPLAVRAAKAAITEGISMALPKAMECELKYYNTLLDSRDRHEGVNAFNQKRKAHFTGE